MCTSVEIQGADERECRVTNAGEAESSRRPVDRSIDFGAKQRGTRGYQHFSSLTHRSQKKISTKRHASSGRQCAIATSESL